MSGIIGNELDNEIGQTFSVNEEGAVRSGASALKKNSECGNQNAGELSVKAKELGNVCAFRD